MNLRSMTDSADRGNLPEKPLPRNAIDPAAVAFQGALGNRRINALVDGDARDVGEQGQNVADEDGTPLAEPLEQYVFKFFHNCVLRREGKLYKFSVYLCTIIRRLAVKAARRSMQRTVFVAFYVTRSPFFLEPDDMSRT